MGDEWKTNVIWGNIYCAQTEKKTLSSTRPPYWRRGRARTHAPVGRKVQRQRLREGDSWLSLWFFDARAKTHRAVLGFDVFLKSRWHDESRLKSTPRKLQLSWQLLHLETILILSQHYPTNKALVGMHFQLRFCNANCIWHLTNKSKRTGEKDIQLFRRIWFQMVRLYSACVCFWMSSLHEQPASPS